MAVATRSVTEICLAAKAAARELAQIDSATKDRALLAIADALSARTGEILEANARDLEAGRESGLSAALMDRLALDERRVEAMAAGVREIVALPDPVGEVLDGFRLPNGLDVRKVRVPLGVVAVVYEARPNVTIDAAALALKSGNAIVLRGSSSATHSNAVLAAVAAEAAEAAGLPAGSLSLVAGGGREELAELATQEGVVDLIIPRGGEGLKAALSAVAKVPVIYAASGNCHVYVDESADLDSAREIIVNAKVQRPGVCNAAETLLVHSAVADAFLPAAFESLRDAGVELRGDERARGGRRRRRRGHRRGLGDRVPGARARRAGRRLGGRGDRAHQHLRLRPLGGDRHRLGGRRAEVPARRRRRLRVRERLDPVHRRRPVRDGRRDRQLHAEAARPRADRPARAVHLQVPGRGRRPGPSLVKVGLLGGTFNPPHIGHLVCAQEACAQLELDRVLLVPVHEPPHKGIEADPGVEHRVELCRRAVAGDERLELSLADAEVPGPSFTVDTLRRLHERCPGDDLTFIVGGDMAFSLPTWREPEAILELAELGVAEREGVRRADISERLGDLPAHRLRFFDMPRLDISSSLIRRHVAAGRPIRHLVPDAVVDYIEQAGLYR